MTTTSTTEELSSSERARRHGEVRMLKAIKRKQKYQEPRKRKLLKHQAGKNCDDDDDFENAGDDIRDVDFRLYNDSAKLDVNIVQMLHNDKSILCFSMLYTTFRFYSIHPKQISCATCFC